MEISNQPNGSEMLSHNGFGGRDDAVYLCGGCIRLDRCRMGISSEKLGVDGVVRYRLMAGPDDEGGKNVAHGGWTAGVIDELVGHVALLRGQLAVTGTLEVKFTKPVPIGHALVARAWAESETPSKWHVKAVLELEPGGAELATGKAILVNRDVGHFARHEQWLKAQAKGADDAAS